MLIILFLLLLAILFAWRGNRTFPLVFYAIALIIAIILFIADMNTHVVLQL